jgi:cell division protease FtsH
MRRKVTMADFEAAKDKVLMGSERKSAVIGEREREVTAFHEAGHALVALLQDGTDPVHKVTIIPRGRALGVTQQLPEEDRHTMSRDYALKRIAVMMGGRAAEKIVFDQLTTGAGNDIEVATDLARKMVCEWGMSEAIGPLSFSETQTNPFPGMQGGGMKHRPYSEAVAEEIDAEVRSIVTEQYEFAEQLLEEHRHLLDLMTEALLEFEALDTEEIELLLEYETLDAVRRHRAHQEAEKDDGEDEEAEPERKPKTGFTSKLKEQTTIPTFEPQT